VKGLYKPFHGRQDAVFEARRWLAALLLRNFFANFIDTEGVKSGILSLIEDETHPGDKFGLHALLEGDIGLVFC
jgi:hypothetical protein